MRFYIFLFCATMFGFSSLEVSSQEEVSIDADISITIDKIFEIVKKQTDYNFIYRKEMFKSYDKIALKKGTYTVDSLLLAALPPKDFDFTVTSNKIIMVRERTQDLDQPPPQIQRSISGKVFDEDRKPVFGANIQVKGTYRGTVTAEDGTFELLVSSDNTVLVVSYLGYKNQEVAVGDKSIITVVLEEAINALDEVVLSGGYYNVQSTKKTGSIVKVEAKDIANKPVDNALAAIQGQVSGVDIVPNTGLAGSGINIEIRGRNFLNGSTNPLFLVDGVPFSAESQAFGLTSISFQGGDVSPLNLINPADIESIEILKDGDATAIYGSRGANGVVLITTKKGKAGDTKFNVNFGYTAGKVPRFANLLNTQQFLEVRREAFLNDGTVPDGQDHDFNGNWDPNRETDWQEVLIGGTSVRKNLQLSLSGGSEQTQFLISGTVSNQTDVFPGDFDYSRIAVHSNINHTSKNKRFQLNFTANYATDDNTLPGTDYTPQAISLAPNAPALFDEEGNLNFQNGTFNNPLTRLENEYRAQTNNLIANIALSYKILDNLELKTKLGFNDIRFDAFRTDPASRNTLPSFNITSEFSRLFINDDRRSSWIVEPQIDWKKKWGDMDISFLVGATFQEQTSEGSAEQRNGFPTDALILNRSAAREIIPFQETENIFRFQSFFGRLNLSWKDRYILNITGRRDGSTRFGPGRQFGNFGAVGGAWIFSRETFLKESKFLSLGKLRGSYGITGSDNIPDFAFLNTYTLNGNLYDGDNALEPERLFNPDFQWEENRKIEFALELGFLKDRILFTTAWFANRSSNQLTGIPQPATTGFRSFTGNFDAIVDNTGLELDVTTRNIITKNFSWRSSVNVSVLRNKLVEFEGLESSPFRNRFVVGESLNIQRVFRSLGVDPETGIYQFQDFNNDGDITFVDDREAIVDLTPDFYGGFSNNLTYKNFELDFLFQFRKQQVRNFFDRSIGVGSRLQNAPVQVLDRWQQPGDNAPVQRYFSSSALNREANTAGLRQAGSSTGSFSDGSFVRLQSVSLSYRFPEKIYGFFDANIFVQGQNLFVITNADRPDPQIGFGSLPQLRQLTLGVNLGF